MLENSAKILLQRDFELSEMNERYDRQLIEFSVMQEAILLASQIKDRRQMFEKVGSLLTGHLEYDRYFIVEQVGGQFQPLVSFGFDDSPFEAKFETLKTTNVINRLFKEQPFWLFQPTDDALANEVISILNVSSAAIVQLQSSNFRGILGVAMAQPLDILEKEDINFLMLLVGQLNAIVENIDSFNLLAKQNEELRLLDKAKTTFLSIASHQLRTPLSVMKFALSHLAKPQTGPLNDDQKEIVEEMNKSNVRIINLVNNLLNITRLEQNRLDIEPEMIALRSLVEEVVREQQDAIQLQQVRVTIDVPEILSFEADKALIRETLVNLVSNGVKYNKLGGLLVISAKHMGENLILTVGDTGIGITKEEQPRLFAQFFRAQQAQSIDPQGVGLGLYTVREFIKLHHGQIAVNSIEGQGTTFSILLPMKQPKTSKPAATDVDSN
jgi:signal transduction histidine kinase